MRLCDVDELKEWVYNWFEKNAYYHPYSKSNKIPMTELYDILDRLPTVDAVPVVRCKDCKWKGHIGCAITIVDESDKPMDKDFCSWGERREDETD